MFLRLSWPNGFQRSTFVQVREAGLRGPSVIKKADIRFGISGPAIAQIPINLG